MSGASKVRRAYEKHQRPAGGRWGRDEGVPLPIYYELDDLRAQLTGISNLLGTTRQDLYALTRVSPGGIQDDMVPVSLQTGLPESLKGKTFIRITEATKTFIPEVGASPHPTNTLPDDLEKESRIIGLRFMAVVAFGATFPQTSGVLRFQSMEVKSGGLSPLADLHTEEITLTHEVWTTVSQQFSNTKWWKQGSYFRGLFNPGVSDSHASLFAEITVLQKEPYLIE